jgi:hypothetical protein
VDNARKPVKRTRMIWMIFSDCFIFFYPRL